IDPSEPGRNLARTFSVTADPEEALGALEHQLAGQAPYRKWADEVRQAMLEWQATVETEASKRTTPISVQQLCMEIGNVLPDDAIVVGDTGFSAIWSANLIPLRSSRQTYL